MSEFFWKSTRNARLEHFCDYCCQKIQPRETYTREVWAPRGTRNFFVMKHHIDPSCPPLPNPFEESAPVYEAFEEKTSLIFVGEVRQVLKVGVDGKILIESETHFVPQLIAESELSESFDPDYDSDDDVPF